MTEQDTTNKTRRVTKAALQAFIAEEEARRDWHTGGIPSIWNAVRDFADMPPLTQEALIERKIEQVTRALNEETDPDAKRKHRSSLVDLLNLLKAREDRQSQKEPA